MSCQVNIRVLGRRAITKRGMLRRCREQGSYKRCGQESDNQITWLHDGLGAIALSTDKTVKVSSTLAVLEPVRKAWMAHCMKQWVFKTSSESRLVTKDGTRRISVQVRSVTNDAFRFFASRLDPRHF